MIDIRSYLKENTLVFDGGLGTYYAQRSRGGYRDCEWANLTAPEEISAIHRAYLDAGSRALKTNTYACNRLRFSETECAAMLREGVKLARRCAGERAYVFADIGPIDARDDTDLFEEYRSVLDRFLELRMEHFLLETLSTDRYLPELAAYLKQRCPGAFLLVSFAASPDGFTREGRWVQELLDSAAEVPQIDAVGLNCVSGAKQMRELLERLRLPDKPFSVMPTAGYPTVRANRVYYNGDPGYFAAQTAAMRSRGAVILGGCCGTTPEHIAALRQALSLPTPARGTHASPEKSTPETRPDPFWAALCDTERRPFAVELEIHGRGAGAAAPRRGGDHGGGLPGGAGAGGFEPDGL